MEEITQTQIDNNTNSTETLTDSEKHKPQFEMRTTHESDEPNTAPIITQTQKDIEEVHCKTIHQISFRATGDKLLAHYVEVIIIAKQLAKD
jgi:hypothetical protein